MFTARPLSSSLKFSWYIYILVLARRTQTAKPVLTLGKHNITAKCNDKNRLNFAAKSATFPLCAVLNNIVEGTQWCGKQNFAIHLFNGLWILRTQVTQALNYVLKMHLSFVLQYLVQWIVCYLWFFCFKSRSCKCESIKANYY